MSGSVRQAVRGARDGAAARLARRGRLWRGAAAVTVPAVLAAFAVLHPGAPVSQVDLNDAGVWLTNTTEMKLGRYNTLVEELNGGLVAMSAEIDVLQDEDDVLLLEAGTVSVVDPASVALAAQVTVPFGAQVRMSGGTAAVVQPTTGAVWARPVSGIGSIDIEEPDLELGPGGSAVVADDGTVLAVDADGALQRGRVDDDGLAADDDGALHRAPRGEIGAVTAVGDQLVALAGTVVHTPSGTTDLTELGAELTLQQPGPRSDVVLVATPSSLLEVPLGGGAVREHPTGGSGEPAAPVRVGACAQGAWASPVGSSVVLCDGQEPAVTDLAEMSAAAELVFRVNRDVVVLNDTVDGRLWVPLEDPDVREPNWLDIERQEETEDTEEESDQRESTQNLQAECTAQSAPPTAADDEYGVRAGRTTILSVIDNDASSDCGILAISEFDPIEDDAFGEIVPIHGGRAFQLTTAPGAQGVKELTYTITDGRGTTAPSTATVTLTIRDDAVNEAPVQIREGAFSLEQGGTTSYDVLPDFRDPDGDPLVLTGATITAGAGTVRTRQDGLLTFEADGGALGAQQVTVLVSDGVSTVEGRVLVNVRPAGSLPPVVEPVHAQTYVDEEIVVRPLDSVRSVSAEPVRLAGVDEVAGATVTADLDAGTFAFSAPTPGVYYVPFLVTASPQQATGLARIDVQERPEQPRPPVAVLDTALLPPGGEVTIDPLANDEDPSRGVLVLQSVEVPDGSRLEVAVLQHRLLRISSEVVLEAPTTVRYTMSNGVSQATGEVLVQPVPATVTQQPPVVPDVTASVRTGGVVTVDVLEGAYDPDGDPLTLVPELAEPLGAGEGLLFASGDLLRYQAPDRPMRVEATFEVEDAAGNKASATLTVDVHAPDAETKEPPRPLPLTARVFQGETVRIPVPLTGIDPDGDGVYLLGLDRAPAKGRIVATGPDWFEYEALPSELGTDTFTYAVEDWVGQRAVATIRVGIAERPGSSADVISRDDAVTVRPGQSVEVRVLANDVDMSGGELILDPALEPDAGVVAEAQGRRVVVEAPSEPGTVHVGYTARNERGGYDRATLSVTVAADATISPPIAQDVVVPAADTINRTTVEVDVLAVAENPSGPLGDLAVSVHESAADVAVVQADGTVLVTLGERARTFPYRLTNTSPQAEGASTYAFITVPALGDFPPMPRPGADPLVVVAGQPLLISLAEQVLVGPGRTARIEDATTVTATKSDGSSLVVDRFTLTYTAQRSYAGPASISFVVSDGASGDTQLREQLLTLPITVLAAEDHPPTFQPSTIDIAPGDTVTVDLLNFTSAPVGTAESDAATYEYVPTSTPPAGLQVSIDGTRLTATADPTLPKGTSAGVQLEVRYGVDGVVPGAVNFQVTASKRRLAIVKNHTVPDAVQGGTATVSVLEGAFNPFQEEGEVLTVLSAVVEAGRGTAGVSGQQVAVRPAADFVGDMVVRYRVADATGEVERQVEGRITVTVRGRPATPLPPRVGEAGDGTLRLAWDAPAANGAEITGYRVTASPGGAVQGCPTTTCTITGLTNGQAYTFRVEAQNAVGWSDPSGDSGPGIPDVIPPAPARPALSWADGSVTATWTAPQFSGTAITEYQLEISPAPPGGGVSATTSATSYTFTGLANGESYTVRVRAVNRAGEGAWSASSDAQVPAAPPGAPVLDGQRSGQGYFGGGRIEVWWAAPAANGDPVKGYRIRVNDGPPIATTSLTHVVDPARPGSYRFQVQAENKAGWGPWSETFTVAHSTVPATMSPPGVSVLTGQGAVELSFSEPENGGSPINRYEYSQDGSTGSSGEVPRNRRITGLSAGEHSFRVRACNNEGCGEWSGPTSAQVTTAPGDVRDLRVVLDDPAAPTRAWAEWSPPSQDGGLPVHYKYRYRFNGGEWSRAERADELRSPALDIPNRVIRDGGTIEFEVFVENDHGGRSPTDVAVLLRIEPPPPPPEPTPEPTP